MFSFLSLTSPVSRCAVFAVILAAPVATACGRSGLEEDFETDGSSTVTGVIGASGATGTTGAAGMAGATGTTGAAGMAGAMGTTGATAATGTTGAAGMAGATGTTGAAGMAGATGTTGASGATGASSLCGPATCPTGCCAPDGSCDVGDSVNACGTHGELCQFCGSAGGMPTCDSASRLCTSTVSTCGPPNCAGCCRADTCLPGTDVSSCGFGGQACQLCSGAESCTATKSGGTCLATPPCQASCLGCCDQNGQCEAGFLDTACGQGGGACTNCDALGPASTCDTNSTPRVCASQQIQCPAPYGGCAPGTTAAAPVPQSVCSASDLQNAMAACANGAHTPGCQAFFQFEQAANPACEVCLSAFDYDFTEANGLIACLSPFVDAPCGNDLGCLSDCESQSCAMCSNAASTAQCRTQAASGACSAFVNGAQCITGAFFGPGAFCSPLGKLAQFGAWLGTVGAHYCQE